MNPRTVLTLANGRDSDLLNPNIEDFRDLEWAAEHLAKENRYNGATPGVCYSVAQHTTECVLSAMAQTGDTQLAAYLSLHDVHEALLKDDTTPKKRAFAAIAEEKFGVLASQVMAAFDELTDRHDKVIHEAAGLPWPPTPEMARAIKHYDRVLLVTEWRDLMGGYPLPNMEAYADVTPLKRTIVPHNKWQSSQALLCLAWRTYLPALQSTNPAGGKSGTPGDMTYERT
jgi:5'-deoxynucleotidase YfbR-like HD superfamily hydrolase